MNKLLPALVCGFAAGVLQTVPVIKSFACCLILPAAAFFAIYLDQRANNTFEQIEGKKGLVLGLLTGVFAALFASSFDILITLITKKNDLVLSFGDLQNFLTNFPVEETIKVQITAIFTEMVNEIKATGFSSLYAATIIINSLVTNILFGIVGGVIGTQYWNARIYKKKKQEDEDE